MATNSGETSLGSINSAEGLLAESKQAKERLEKMCGAVRTLLECMGEDPDREGLLDTPARYAKALLFLTKGYEVDIESIVNNALFHEGHNEMMHIGYVPSGSVIGLSKLPRIAEMFARRLQIQERLTQQVAHAIMRSLKPKGVMVVMESCHLCMVMRGVEKAGSTMITTCALSCFEEESEMRKEFQVSKPCRNWQGVKPMKQTTESTHAVGS